MYTRYTQFIGVDNMNRYNMNEYNYDDMLEEYYEGRDFLTEADGDFNTGDDSMDKNELTIEDCINQLKSITEKLNSPDISIEESIKLYEEGKKYSDKAKEILGVYRDKIDIIGREESGSVVSTARPVRRWSP